MPLQSFSFISLYTGTDFILQIFLLLYKKLVISCLTNLFGIDSVLKCPSEKIK